MKLMEADDDILRNWSVSQSWSIIEGHIQYETKFISHGKSIKAKEFCILILHVLVCVGMSQKFLAKAI